MAVFEPLNYFTSVRCCQNEFHVNTPVIFFPNTAEHNPSLVFEASRQNDLLTVEAIESMCNLEKEIIRTHHLFHQSCLLACDGSCPDSWSLGWYVALLTNKSSCGKISNTDIDDVRSLLQMCAPFYMDGSFTRCTSDNDCTGVPTVCTAFNHATYNIFHLVTSKSFVEGIAVDKNTKLKIASTYLPLYNYGDNSEQIYLENIHGKTFSDENVVLKAVKFKIKYALFQQFLFSDIVYIGIGLGLILILLWIYTKSFLVMLAALFNFILSLILAYFFYVVVLQRPFFPFVNITALILLIGIGADDTFVYIDLWRKALSDHRGKALVIAVEDALRHATATMFVTSATTTTALFSSMLSDITAVKCFSLFSGLAILMNFVLTLSWLPAVIILQHRLMEICCKKGDDEISSWSRALERMLTPFRVFFDKILPFIVVKFKYLWLVSFTLLGIGGAVVVFFKPGLKLPSSSEFQVLRTDNYLEQYDLTYKEHFNYEKSGNRMEGFVLFGVKSKYSGNPWDPDDYGKLFVDHDFEFSSPEHQLWFQKFCHELKNQSFYHSTSSWHDICLISQLNDFMNRDCGENDALFPCCNKSTFPYPTPVFTTCFTQCYASGNCFISMKYSQSDEKILAFDISFLSTTFTSFDFNVMNKYWSEVNGWMQTQFATAPQSLSSVFFTSQSGDQLWFFDLQKNLASGTLISLGVTFAISTAILICTILNIILALYAILSVAFVTFVTMGSLVLLGWELNIFESVIFTLAIGLSIDFTIHYGVAYSLAPFYHRIERTEYSIQTMGSAITIAALSTFIAGALMLPATVNAYLQLGVFMMLVMSISWVYSTLYFQSLCMIFGPHGKFGQLNYFCIKEDPAAVAEGNRANGDLMSVENDNDGKKSQVVNTINREGADVKVGDINMGTPSANPSQTDQMATVSSSQPDLIPHDVALLPGTPHKDLDSGDSTEHSNLQKTANLNENSTTNPSFVND